MDLGREGAQFSGQGGMLQTVKGGRLGAAMMEGEEENVRRRPMPCRREKELTCRHEALISCGQQGCSAYGRWCGRGRGVAA
jgi:hypothetical protein